MNSSRKNVIDNNEFEKAVIGLSTKYTLNELKQKIDTATRKLTILEEPNKPIPELINSTNLLRSNEFLTKTNIIKTELISSYELYSNELRNILTDIRKIRTEINSLKSKPKHKSRKNRLTKRKKKKKTRRQTHTKPTRKRKSSKRKH